MKSWILDAETTADDGLFQPATEKIRAKLLLRAG